MTDIDEKLLSARDNKDDDFQRRRREAKKRFDARLKKRPRISDEEFMAETEVSDEQYARGLTLPGVGQD